MSRARLAVARLDEELRVARAKLPWLTSGCEKQRWRRKCSDLLVKCCKASWGYIRYVPCTVAILGSCAQASSQAPYALCHTPAMCALCHTQAVCTMSHSSPVCTMSHSSHACIMSHSSIGSAMSYEPAISKQCCDVERSYIPHARLRIGIAR